MDNTGSDCAGGLTYDHSGLRRATTERLFSA